MTKPQRPTVSLFVRIDPTLKARLSDFAWVHGMSERSVMEAALAAHLDREETRSKRRAKP